MKLWFGLSNGFEVWYETLVWVMVLLIEVWYETLVWS